MRVYIGLRAGGRVGGGTAYTVSLKSMRALESPRIDFHVCWIALPCRALGNADVVTGALRATG